MYTILLLIWPMLTDKGRIIYLGLLSDGISDIPWRKEGGKTVRQPLESPLIFICSWYTSQEKKNTWMCLLYHQISKQYVEVLQKCYNTL